MIIKIITFTLISMLSLSSYSECVHESVMSYDDAYKLASEGNMIHVETDGVFKKFSNKKWTGEKLIQWAPNAEILKGNLDYNDQYLTYYTPERMDKYLADMTNVFEQRGYTLKVIGRSVKGRPLYALYPKNFNNESKKVLMFGRHHGDEGTANWIIEGFLNKVFTPGNDWLDNFDIVLYPMVNPDGAHDKTRYNSNGRDLNRVWGDDSSESSDEVRTIHAHLDELVKDSSDFLLALDMHGSFTEDFIYRVSDSFRSRSFYNTQQTFINKLGEFDPWQRGTFKTSNGHAKMARIRLVRDFGVNALTHETIRNIPRSSARSIDDLKEQGEAIESTTIRLYTN